MFKSSTPGRFQFKLPLKLKDFPSWRPQVFAICNKSIRIKQANPSTKHGNFKGKRPVVLDLNKKLLSGKNRAPYTRPHAQALL